MKNRPKKLPDSNKVDSIISKIADVQNHQNKSNLKALKHPSNTVANFNKGGVSSKTSPSFRVVHAGDCHFGEGQIVEVSEERRLEESHGNILVTTGNRISNHLNEQGVSNVKSSSISNSIFPATLGIKTENVRTRVPTRGAGTPEENLKSDEPSHISGKRMEVDIVAPKTHSPTGNPVTGESATEFDPQRPVTTHNRDVIEPETVYRMDQRMSKAVVTGENTTYGPDHSLGSATRNDPVSLLEHTLHLQTQRQGGVS